MEFKFFPEEHLQVLVYRVRLVFDPDLKTSSIRFLSLERVQLFHRG
jgi:hypothetical protein